MAASSIREAVAVKVEALLNAIAQTGDYETTPLRVKRGEPKAAGEHTKTDLPAIYFELGQERRRPEPAQQVECELDVPITAYVYDESKTSTKANELIRDMERALQNSSALAVTALESGQATVWQALLTVIDVDVPREEPIQSINAMLTVSYRAPLTLSAV